jgi:dCMP deaminase
MIDKELPFLFKVADASAERSHAKRGKVGAVVVDTFGRIIATGYNGTHHGADNNCEMTVKENGVDVLKTLDTVIHAEENAMLQAAKRGLPLDGATMVTTLSPCAKCCSRMIQAGIRRVIFRDLYRLHEEVVTEVGKYMMLQQYKSRKFY